MESTTNYKYCTDEIKCISDCREIIKQRGNLIFNPFACNIMNSPGTLDQFNKNDDKLEQLLNGKWSHLKR